MGKRGGKNRGKKRPRNEQEATATSCGVETLFLDDCTGDDDDDDIKNNTSKTILPAPGPGIWDAAWEKISKQYLMPRKNKQEYNSKAEWTPTLVQKHIWPILFSPSSTTQLWNLICLSPTGSGKTLAYGLPLLMARKEAGIALVLVPTRELVQQVGRELKRASKALQASNCIVQTIHGGVDREEQLESIQANLTRQDRRCILVATSGRLVDLLEQEPMLIASVNTVVLDEADQLAKNRDLERQIGSIFEALRHSFALWMFSATWPDRVTPKWREWIQRASPSSSSFEKRRCAVVKIHTLGLSENSDNNSKKQKTEQFNNQSVALETESVGDDKNNDEKDSPSDGSRLKHQWSDIPSNITQTLHVCAEHKKPKKLLTTLQQKIMGVGNKKNGREVTLGIIFFATIKSLQRNLVLLEKETVAVCGVLHSQMNQASREQAVSNFKCGKTPLLLATDIAARGLDVTGIRFVINYDFPGNLEQYVHRCGRAGRDGKPATVYSFFTRNLAPLAADMLQLLQRSGQWVDPNLSALVNDKKPDGKSKTRKDSAKSDDDEGQAAVQESSMDDFGNGKEEDAQPNEEEEFPSLALNRIVLNRASHISDASDSDDEDEADEDLKGSQG